MLFTKVFCGVASPRVCLSLAAGLGIVLAGCGEGGGSVDASLGGGCVHTFEEPILHVESAVNDESNEAIDEIEVWDVSVDGQERTPADVKSQWKDGDAGLELSDDERRLICTIPCGMGTEAGTWSFKAVAEGYAESDASAVAEYAEHEGGCPSYSDGGTRIEVALTPE